MSVSIKLCGHIKLSSEEKKNRSPSIYKYYGLIMKMENLKKAASSIQSKQVSDIKTV